MTKVTYLLGAGASCQALPLASDVITQNGHIPGLATSMINIWKELGQKFHENSNIKLIAERSNYETLCHEFSEFGTLDNYAKLISQTNPAKLDFIKRSLAKYFYIEQYLLKKRDKRYLLFLIKILKDRIINFPKNIKILTWNYDFQMEIAASKYKMEYFRSSAGTYMHDPPLIAYFPGIGISGFNNIKEISLVHLNGIAGHYKRSDKLLNDLIDPDFEINFNRNVEEVLSDIKCDGEYINFAWERNPIAKKAVDISCEIIKNTDILVIVGYSFPDFNYNADKKIMDVVKEKSDLKIFYQDPNIKGDFLYERFDLSDSVKIIWKENTKEFYIPPEILLDK